MRCYTNVHEGYCGIDLHAQTMDCLSLQLRQWDHAPPAYANHPRDLSQGHGF